MTGPNCYLNALGILCAAGDSVTTVAHKLCSVAPALVSADAFGADRVVPLGMCRGDLPEIPLRHAKWQSRNNQFALAALRQIDFEVAAAIKRYGADRVAVIIGSSTAGIAESEMAVRNWVVQGEAPSDYDYTVQEMGACAQFIAELLKVGGPIYGISTACSSGAKALASARRLLSAGLCDAVIAGGVDTLCHLTVRGFSSLEAVSDRQCNPFSRNRNGINIGEGAALFLATTEPRGVRLCGVGEGSDAYHISAPKPSGAGAIRCMQGALEDAGLIASDVDYVNLHGTATPLNDEMESRAMAQVFGLDTPCSSTKPFTGHTLGAAGAVEAGICWLTLTADDNWLPPHVWDGESDPGLPAINLVSSQNGSRSVPQRVLSNSFAFGGSNISLLLERVE
ncbi:MAG: beta-ketoacyl-[acyl-carrier-protein] synthase family protein [Gammaproteobacteria bacterium]|nr:beta-ketoacyl-[acyl-carrier-protein] synthase family protein [Gammaproteobacteria bacterium]